MFDVQRSHTHGAASGERSVASSLCSTQGCSMHPDLIAGLSAGIPSLWTARQRHPHLGHSRCLHVASPISLAKIPWREGRLRREHQNCKTGKAGSYASCFRTHCVSCSTGSSRKYHHLSAAFITVL